MIPKALYVCPFCNYMAKNKEPMKLECKKCSAIGSISIGGDNTVNINWVSLNMKPIQQVKLKGDICL